MLQVGASTRETARSFASWARILKHACSTSEVSHVAPKAVADWLRIRSAGDFEWCFKFAYWQTLCRQPHKDVFSSYTIRTIANLEEGVIYRSCKIRRTNTLIAGTPRRSIECVYHNPTPEVRWIASSVVNSFKTFSMSAVAKLEGGIYAAVRWNNGQLVDWILLHGVPTTDFDYFLESFHWLWCFVALKYRDSRTCTASTTANHGQVTVRTPDPKISRSPIFVRTPDKNFDRNDPTFPPVSPICPNMGPTQMPLLSKHIPLESKEISWELRVPTTRFPWIRWSV